MSASTITWTDTVGTDVLSNGKPEPGDRFSNWVVTKKPIGPSTVGLGTGDTYRFEFRADQVVTFDIAGIPEASMNLMVRLQDFLLEGGTVTVASDRVMASDFATSVLAPDTEPQIAQSDAQLREYTFSVSLLGVAA